MTAYIRKDRHSHVLGGEGAQERSWGALFYILHLETWAWHLLMWNCALNRHECYVELLLGRRSSSRAWKQFLFYLQSQGQELSTQDSIFSYLKGTSWDIYVSKWHKESILRQRERVIALLLITSESLLRIHWSAYESLWNAVISFQDFQSWLNSYAEITF